MNEWILMKLEKKKVLTGSLFLHHSSGGWDGGRASPHRVSIARGTFLSIQNPSVLRRVSKGDQSHFEALETSFVCEGCEVLPKWLCQFFKTHLHLTLGGSEFIVFVGGTQVHRHMSESSSQRKGFLTIKGSDRQKSDLFFTKSLRKEQKQDLREK